MFRRVCQPRRATAVAVMTAMRSLTFEPRLRDAQFLYEDVFDMYGHFAKLPQREGAEPVTKELMDTLLEEAGKLSTSTLFPLYETGDDEPCQLLKDGTVKTPKGYKEAYATFCEGGWTAVNEPEEYGGQGLPPSVGFTTREIFSTANWSFGMYPGLSLGACRTLHTWASKELNAKYLPKLVSGEWSGTMCLTEPQCGTDLSQVKTKALPNPDGSYRITGTKIFISAGDHDMVDNIVHVVLARLPDSEPTTKGLSLFLVPRHVVKEDGSLEEKKNVVCSAIEKKMGIKASATSQLTFEDSVGYLIGEAGAGMKEMFTFMNTARMGTALQGVAHAELAFQNALRYARERGSMRALTGKKEPERVADPIVYHAGVRDNILMAKVVAEGGRALLIDISRMLDLQAAATDPKVAAALDREIGFYTPIAKGCLTEWGLESANRCMQVWGGHGYIKGNGMEQIARDARIATLYEGTTNIQALDFIGRKVLSSKGGNEAKRFGDRVNALCRGHLFSSGQLGSHARDLWLMQKKWKLSIARLAATGQVDRGVVDAAAENFLMYSGYLTMGYYWLRMAEAAKAAIASGKDADGFYQTKLDMADYVFSRFLPRAEGHLKLSNGSSAICKLDHTKWDI